MRTQHLLTALAVACLVGACGDDHSGHSHSKDSKPNTPAAKSGDDHHDHDHGEMKPLGQVQFGGSSIEVKGYGTLEAGDEYHVDIAHTEGELPEVLRLWFGDAAATGVAKSKASKTKDHFHGHVEVPASLGQDARLWIEAEFRGGRREAKDLPLPR